MYLKDQTNKPTSFHIFDHQYFCFDYLLYGEVPSKSEYSLLTKSKNSFPLSDFSFFFDNSLVLLIEMKSKEKVLLRISNYFDILKN